jgi:hypothetical protein
MTSVLFVAVSTIAAARALADVFSWEADYLPADGGFIFVLAACEPESYVQNGMFIQELDDDACPNGPIGATEGYRRFFPELVGNPTFFVEWRVEGRGPNSELILGAPTALAVANSFGEAYTFFISRDLAKLNRDNLLPIVFVPIEPGVLHTHRLELYDEDLYIWFIDGIEVNSGVPEGPFPSDDARCTWLGRSGEFPTVNTWDYIRYGDIAIDESGDFDSDGDVDLRDHFYLSECIEAGFRGNGPNIPADPGCEWADTDGDGDVDWADYGGFQLAYSGGDDG